MIRLRPVAYGRLRSVRDKSVPVDRQTPVDSRHNTSTKARNLVSHEKLLFIYADMFAYVHRGVDHRVDPALGGQLDPFLDVFEGGRAVGRPKLAALEVRDVAEIDHVQHAVGER